MPDQRNRPAPPAAPAPAAPMPAADVPKTGADAPNEPYIPRGLQSPIPGISNAYVYDATEEDMRFFVETLRRLAPFIDRTGILCIRPPPTWRHPPLRMKPSDKFPVRFQTLPAPPFANDSDTAQYSAAARRKRRYGPPPNELPAKLARTAAAASSSARHQQQGAAHQQPQPQPQPQQPQPQLRSQPQPSQRPQPPQQQQPQRQDRQDRRQPQRQGERDDQHRYPQPQSSPSLTDPAIGKEPLPRIPRRNTATSAAGPSTAGPSTAVARSAAAPSALRAHSRPGLASLPNAREAHRQPPPPAIRSGASSPIKPGVGLRSMPMPSVAVRPVDDNAAAPGASGDGSAAAPSKDGTTDAEKKEKKAEEQRPASHGAPSAAEARTPTASAPQLPSPMAALMAAAETPGATTTATETATPTSHPGGVATTDPLFGLADTEASPVVVTGKSSLSPLGRSATLLGAGGDDDVSPSFRDLDAFATPELGQSERAPRYTPESFPHPVSPSDAAEEDGGGDIHVPSPFRLAGDGPTPPARQAPPRRSMGGGSSSLVTPSSGVISQELRALGMPTTSALALSDAATPLLGKPLQPSQAQADQQEAKREALVSPPSRSDGRPGPSNVAAGSPTPGRSAPHLDDDAKPDDAHRYSEEEIIDESGREDDDKYKPSRLAAVMSSEAAAPVVAAGAAASLSTFKSPGSPHAAAAHATPTAAADTAVLPNAQARADATQLGSPANGSKAAPGERSDAVNPTEVSPGVSHETLPSPGNGSGPDAASKPGVSTPDTQLPTPTPSKAGTKRGADEVIEILDGSEGDKQQAAEDDDVIEISAKSPSPQPRPRKRRRVVVQRSIKNKRASQYSSGEWKFAQDEKGRLTEPIVFQDSDKAMAYAAFKKQSITFERSLGIPITRRGKAAKAHPESEKEQAGRINELEQVFWESTTEGVLGKKTEVAYGVDVEMEIGSHEDRERIREQEAAEREVRERSEPDINVGNINRRGVLRYLPIMPGINHSMFYVGQALTRFCWHVEDGFLNSLSYLHVADSSEKVWYGIPSAHALMLEKYAAEEVFSKSLQKRFPANLLLMNKTTIFDPRALIERGIPVFRIVHQPGTFVVTAPRAYHAGFNAGFNIAEAVNFASPTWLPMGQEAVQVSQRIARPLCIPWEFIVFHEARHIACRAWSELENPDLPAERQPLVEKRLKEDARHVASALEFIIRTGEQAITNYLTKSNCRVEQLDMMSVVVQKASLAAEFGHNSGVVCSVCGHPAHFYALVCGHCDNNPEARCAKHFDNTRPLCFQKDHEPIIIRRHNALMLLDLLQRCEQKGDIVRSVEELYKRNQSFIREWDTPLNAPGSASKKREPKLIMKFNFAEAVTRKSKPRGSELAVDFDTSRDLYMKALRKANRDKKRAKVEKKEVKMEEDSVKEEDQDESDGIEAVAATIARGSARRGRKRGASAVARREPTRRVAGVRDRRRGGRAAVKVEEPLQQMEVEEEVIDEEMGQDPKEYGSSDSALLVVKPAPRNQMDTLLMSGAPRNRPRKGTLTPPYRRAG